MSPKKLFGSIIAFVVVLFALMAGCGSFYTIDSGNVGITKTLGKVSMTEVGEGLNWKWPFITTVEEYSIKEIELSLTDLTPKAMDNLSLAKMDVSIWYRVVPGYVAEMKVKYAAAEARDQNTGDLYPAFNVVRKEARNAVYATIATLESLQMHRERALIEAVVGEMLQASLEADDPDVFEISRVVVRAVVTDPAIEASIKLAVENEKKLEAKRVEKEIERENAEIEFIRAQGIRRANDVINTSLTREYLQHELNLALMQFATSGANTVLVPYGMESMGVMIDQFTRLGNGGGGK